MTNITQYRDRISEIGALFDSAVEEIKIVPSILDWCKSNGIDETSADRAGKCLRDRATGKHLILISEFVSDDEKQSIIDAMHIRGSAPNDIKLLQNEWLFIKHLLLHECAHASNQGFSELQCDNWAFDKMKEINI